MAHLSSKWIVPLLTLTLIALVGCSSKLGSSKDPALTDIVPSKGAPGAMVIVSIENYDPAQDVVHFDGVPVALLATSEETSKKTVQAISINASAPEVVDGTKTIKTYKFTPSSGIETPTPDKETTEPSEDKKEEAKVLPPNKILSKFAKVPANLSPRVISVTVRRGDYESEPLDFEVLTAGASNGTTQPTGNSNQNPPPPPPDPDPDPDPTAASLAYLHFSGFSAKNEGAMFSWSVTNVKSAFLLAPISGYTLKNPLAYENFIGFPQNPNLAGKKSGEKLGDLFDGLLQDPLGKFADDYWWNVFVENSPSVEPNEQADPYSYCLLPRGIWNEANISPEKAEALCSDEWKDYDLPVNYVSIFIPLNPGETSKSGTWTLRNPSSPFSNAFTLYYRDWANERHYIKLLCTPSGCKDPKKEKTSLSLKLLKVNKYEAVGAIFKKKGFFEDIGKWFL
ncbi:MAG: hypothetical protein A3F89_00535 [Deltaproteobacteria bacterium RIFCSPLOWO2_12_FULL_50_11]|nr:MAG: hypothetical protein A3F89_00535 [Deltaproteobacteria bacterium RIFCSPLOWO2_12_FULL_50_11]